MQEVELLDGDDASPALGPAAARAPARNRRGLWWTAAGVAAVALSLAGTQQVLDAREDAAVARLAAVPGVVPADRRRAVVAGRSPPGRGLQPLGRGRARRWWTASWWSRRTGRSPSPPSTSAPARRSGRPRCWVRTRSGPRRRRTPTAAGARAMPVPRGEPSTLAVCVVTDGFVRYAATTGPRSRSPRPPAAWSSSTHDGQRDHGVGRRGRRAGRPPRRPRRRRRPRRGATGGRRARPADRRRAVAVRGATSTTRMAQRRSRLLGTVRARATSWPSHAARGWPLRSLYRRAPVRDDLRTASGRASFGTDPHG